MPTGSPQNNLPVCRTPAFGLACTSNAHSTISISYQQPPIAHVLFFRTLLNAAFPSSLSVICGLHVTYSACA